MGGRTLAVAQAVHGVCCSSAQALEGFIGRYHDNNPNYFQIGWCLSASPSGLQRSAVCDGRGPVDQRECNPDILGKHGRHFAAVHEGDKIAEFPLAECKVEKSTSQFFRM